MQRLLDIIFASFALIVLSPLLIPIVIILRLSGEGEVFYFQERVGKDGRTIGLFKFVTMLKNSPNIGTGTITLKNDTRILPVGRFLRKTKINELPQLLNVLRGDMSIVGPRPQTRRCFDVFPESSQSAIIQVQPGLSGIGSMIFRDEEQLMHGHHDASRYYDEVIAPYKGALEEWYVKNRGFTTYFKVVFATIWVVILPKSNIVWKLFSGLPQPPSELRGPLRA